MLEAVKNYDFRKAAELKDLLKLIAELKAILESPQKILDIIKKELLELKGNYADKRKSEISDSEITELKITSF